MDDRRALMAAIIANPDDDTPRLALADWLDEYGNAHDRARAAFIRLQVEAAKLPVGDAKRARLEADASKLADAHRLEWVKPLAPLTVKVFGGVLPDIAGEAIDWPSLSPSGVQLRLSSSIETHLWRIHEELVRNRLGREAMIRASVDMICVELA